MMSLTRLPKIETLSSSDEMFSEDERSDGEFFDVSLSDIESEPKQLNCFSGLQSFFNQPRSNDQLMLTIGPPELKFILPPEEETLKSKKKNICVIS